MTKKRFSLLIDDDAPTKEQVNSMSKRDTDTEDSSRLSII